MASDLNATKEEINNAYRQYSKLFHPDKHQSEEKKLKADILFNKIKRAHEVLSDPQKRVIYDVAGQKGLDTEGWELQARHKTPQEIMEEYERLRKENEEKLLQQKTNPKGSITVGVDATDVFEQYSIDYEPTLPNVEISTMHITQSVECPLTTKETLTLSGQLSSYNGKGQGNVTASIRKIFNHKTWGEADLTLGSDPSLGFRCFRAFWPHRQIVAGLHTQILPGGNVGIVYSLGMTQQFDKNFYGRLNLRAGFMPGVNVAGIYERNGHRLVVGCQIGIPSSFLVFSYSYFFKDTKDKYKTSLRLDTKGVTLELGCEKKITKFSRLGASVSMGMASGVAVKIKLSRGSQTFLVPIQLSESFVPAAALYGSLLPILAYSIMKRYVIDPHVKEQTEKNINEKKKKHAELFEKKKQEAAAALDLMEESIEKSYEVERSRDGLVIVGALYGKDVMTLSSCIEVSRSLQSLVKNSKLFVSESINLYDLPGFYDPCFGEAKSLLIEYDFSNRRHRHVFAEGERIVLPDAAHLLR